MTNLPKFLAAVLVAAMLGACGTSSMTGETGSSMLLASSSEPAADGSARDAGAKPAAGGRNADTRRYADPRQEEAQKKAEQFTAVADPNSKAYRIGPRDVLDVNVFQVPELSKVVQVSEAGTINYPLAGEIVAGSRTAREIEQELTKKLGAKYLQNPAITVFVKEHNSQRVTVEGAVSKPGVIPMAGGMTLLQAIAQAGGLGANADKSVVIFRMAGGKRAAMKYDVSDIRDGGLEDPQLQTGDVIIVPTSDMKTGVEYVVKFLPLASIAPLL
jgi:polysaccharide biosynthesis/export protein